jgi:hypothetical protein
MRTSSTGQKTVQASQLMAPIGHAAATNGATAAASVSSPARAGWMPLPPPPPPPPPRSVKPAFSRLRPAGETAHGPGRNSSKLVGGGSSGSSRGGGGRSG